MRKGKQSGTSRPLISTHQKFYIGFKGKARSRKPGSPVNRTTGGWTIKVSFSLDNAGHLICNKSLKKKMKENREESDTLDVNVY